MKTIKITDPTVVEQIKNVMATATPSVKGLMPAYLSPSLNADDEKNKYTFDLNDIKRDARLVINSTTINNPITASGGWAICLSYTTMGVVIQLVFDYWAAASLYSRSYNNAKWSAWTKIK